MIISTPRTDRRRAAGGFTLPEILVAATLAAIVLAGVLAAFLMIGRTGYAASNYSEMDAQVRRALETFGADARRSADVRWHDRQSLTLMVVNSGTAASPVTYAYDSEAASPTYRAFYRVPGDITSTAPRLVLVHHVAPDFAFARYKLEQPGVPDNTAATDLETKQLQVTLRTARTGATTVAATQTAISARYVLRNKRVSN
jgi:type II secretory pathway component PulJ